MSRTEPNPSDIAPGTRWVGVTREGNRKVAKVKNVKPTGVVTFVSKVASRGEMLYTLPIGEFVRQFPRRK